MIIYLHSDYFSMYHTIEFFANLMLLLNDYIMK